MKKKNDVMPILPDTKVYYKAMAICFKGQYWIKNTKTN